jgi:hypothetical protein
MLTTGRYMMHQDYEVSSVMYAKKVLGQVVLRLAVPSSSKHVDSWAPRSDRTCTYLALLPSCTGQARLQPECGWD